MLASDQRAVVNEATYNPLICYENSLCAKKQPAIFGCVLERSSWLPYAQQGLGSRLQLLEHQVDATKVVQSWPLRQALKSAPMEVKYHPEMETPHTMIEVLKARNRLPLLLTISINEHNMMIEVMNHIKVLLKSTERSGFFITLRTTHYTEDLQVTARLRATAHAVFIQVNRRAFFQYLLNKDHSRRTEVAANQTNFQTVYD